MGICCDSQSLSRNKNHIKNNLTIEKSNLSKFKRKYYNEINSSLLVSTDVTFNKRNYTPVIYSINKFGIQVKTKQKITQPLKFIFHLYNFKCKMLTENTLYILQIIFDGKEFPLSFGNGNNPSFIFNETFGKEITFEKMSTSYLEIYLYTHKTMLNNTQNLTKGEILAESQIYSCFKINLLTIALSPEKHDLILMDPKRMRVQLGRISYFISCKHIEDIYFRINGFKINLYNLKYNEIALNLKFENKNFNREKQSQYTDNFIGIPNNKENIMIYEYSNDKNDISLNEGLSEDSSYLVSEESKNQNNNDESNIKIEEKINQNNFKYEENNNCKIINDNKTINNKTLESNNKNKNIFDNKNNIERNFKNKISEKLFFHGKMSMNDLYNSEFSLNIFSVRLRNSFIEENNNKFESKDSKSDKIMKKKYCFKKLDLPFIAKSSYARKSRQNVANLNLINSYELIGISSLNFNLLLHELEEKISKISYRLFQSMSNKKNSLIKTLSGSKIMKFGIEQDLSNRAQSNKNLYNINNNEIQYRIQNLTLNLFISENLNCTEEIYWEGELIGNMELNLEVNNLPLIRQIKFGVMTETGFEINSIFLYDNLNISNDLPQELLDLIKLKEKFEEEIDFSILKKIQLCLEQTIEDNFLYYGYSSNRDLYQGQAVIIDLGLGLFDLLDKINFEYFGQIFEILKLITKRSEFDLSTLSTKWFKSKRILKKKESSYILKADSALYFSFNYDEMVYEFNDIYLIEKKIIEKFLTFHSQLLNYCLNNLGNKQFSDFILYYLSFAFVQIPQFRKSFINIIVNSIDLKNNKYLKFASHNILNFSKKESSNINSNNNYLLWDTLFYQRLDSSINIYISDYNKLKNNTNKKNNINEIENINGIKEQLMNIKYLTEIKEDHHQQNWYTKLSKRDFIFYDLIYELFHYINIIKNKIYLNSNQSNNFFNFQNNENANNLVGVNTLINAINYDLLIKDAINYPKQINEIIPLFYSNITIINNFITIILSTTNAYDTSSIFSIINILDHLFNKRFDYLDYNQDYIKDNIDYNLIKKSFLILINSDNSLAIAKFIWFYYKNISLLSYHHINDIITSLLTSLFFKLFFHWSFQVREIFYYFIIFILGYKIKKQIKPKKEDNDDDNNDNNDNNAIITHRTIKASFRKKISFNIFANMEHEFNQNRINSLDNFFYVENYLFEDMEIIKELQIIIQKEKVLSINMDNIEKIKDEKILNKIPQEPHGNIFECVMQYNSVFTKFNIWEKNIKDNHISENKIEYPKMDIFIIKDDTIEYEF